MNKLVSESLTEYINGENVEQVNEAIDPATIEILGGTLTALLAAGGLGVLHDKLKSSSNKVAQKIGGALDKVGKAAGDSIKGGSTSESLAEELSTVNEAALDPQMIELAQITAGSLGAVLAAGGGALLIDKLQKSENPTAKKFAAFLGKLGKGAQQGVSQ